MHGQRTNCKNTIGNVAAKKRAARQNRSKCVGCTHSEKPTKRATVFSTQPLVGGNESQHPSLFEQTHKLLHRNKRRNSPSFEATIQLCKCRLQIVICSCRTYGGFSNFTMSNPLSPLLTAPGSPHSEPNLPNIHSTSKNGAKEFWSYRSQAASL